MQDESKIDQQIEHQVTDALEKSVDNLSPDVRRKLNQIRLTATEKKGNRFRWWKQASAISFVFAVVISMKFLPVANNVSNGAIAEVMQDDLFQQELLLEDLEMLEDLEFAYWIAEEAQFAAL